MWLVMEIIDLMVDMLLCDALWLREQRPLNVSSYLQ